MNNVDWILFALIAVHAWWAWKMLFHAWANQPDKKWTWVFMFYLTGGLASFYYYFVHKRPKDLERKKFGSG